MSICEKPTLNLGTLKVLLSFFVPFAFGLFVAAILQFGVGRYLRWLGEQGNAEVARLGLERPTVVLHLCAPLL